MSLAKSLYYRGCSVLPVGFYKTLAQGTTYLPYHHTVSDEVLPHIANLYPYKNVKQFTSDVDFLLKNFKAVSPAEILSSIKKDQQLPANAFLLTFDDGFREVHDIIAPILESKGIPAIFFINPAFIDNKKLFYRSKISLLISELKKNDLPAVRNLFAKAMHIKDASVENIIHTFKSSKVFTDDIVDDLAFKLNFSFENYLNNQQPFLTTDQLFSLNKRGFTIGGHSWDHPDYLTLNIQEQINQTTASCKYVKENFNADPLCFSFPYSDTALPQQLFDELKKTNIDLLFGIQNQKPELQNRMLHRFNAERPQYELSAQLKGVMLFNAWMQKRKTKVVRN